MCCMCLKSLKSECQSGFAGRIHLLSGEVVTQLKACVRWNIETLDMDAFYREVTPSKLPEKDIIPTSLSINGWSENVAGNIWKHHVWLLKRPVQGFLISIHWHGTKQRNTEVLVLFGLIAASWPRAFLAPREVGVIGWQVGMGFWIGNFGWNLKGNSDMKWLEAYWRNLAPVDGFLPLFIGFQPSFWWCRISSIHRRSCFFLWSPSTQLLLQDGMFNGSDCLIEDRDQSHVSIILNTAIDGHNIYDYIYILYIIYIIYMILYIYDIIYMICNYTIIYRMHSIMIP